MNSIVMILSAVELHVVYVVLMSTKSKYVMCTYLRPYSVHFPFVFVNQGLNYFVKLENGYKNKSSRANSLFYHGAF